MALTRALLMHDVCVESTTLAQPCSQPKATPSPVSSSLISSSSTAFYSDLGPDPLHNKLTVYDRTNWDRSLLHNLHVGKVYSQGPHREWNTCKGARHFHEGEGEWRARQAAAQRKLERCNFLPFDWMVWSCEKVTKGCDYVVEGTPLWAQNAASFAFGVSLSAAVVYVVGAAMDKRRVKRDASMGLQVVS